MKIKSLCAIILFGFVFYSCRKESESPRHNHLVVTDKYGNTISSKPVDSGLMGSSSSAFEIYTTGSAFNGFDVYMSFSQGVPNPIVFTPSGSSQGVQFRLHYFEGISWVAARGIVQADVDYNKNSTTKAPKFATIKFNNVLFIQSPPSSSSSFSKSFPDSIWASGTISAKNNDRL